MAAAALLSSIGEGGGGEVGGGEGRRGGEEEGGEEGEGGRGGREKGRGEVEGGRGWEESSSINREILIQIGGRINLKELTLCHEIFELLFSAQTKRVCDVFNKNNPCWLGFYSSPFPQRLSL